MVLRALEHLDLPANVLQKLVYCKLVRLRPRKQHEIRRMKVYGTSIHLMPAISCVFV